MKAGPGGARRPPETLLDTYHDAAELTCENQGDCVSYVASAGRSDARKP